MNAHDLGRRRHVLFTMLTVLEYRYPPGREPALIAAIRTWLSGWTGIGRIVTGMSRQGHDLQLARHGVEGWRATFYPAGRAHSQNGGRRVGGAPGAVGGEPAGGVGGTQAWEGLRRRAEE